MKINISSSIVLTIALAATVAQAQTLVPKWSNTEFGANQIYINGGAYNPTTSNLLVCGSLTHFIDVCEPTAGAITGSLDMTVPSGGTYAVCGMTVDTNGVIYACNYGTAGATHLYEWTNESTASTNIAVNFANSTLGAGAVGKTMAMYGSGTNSVFILSSSTTAAIYVYNNGTAWTSKQLNVSSQTAQGGMCIISWSPTSCAFITKNSGINGEYNVFNPSSASPITVTQTAYNASSILKFSALSPTATTVQGASAYDPLTGLFAFHTRAITNASSTILISNYLVATFPPNSLPAPGGLAASAVTSGIETDSTSQGDTSNYGADFWGGGVYYCIPCAQAANFTFTAYDVSAYKINDITPLTQAKSIGASATFSVVSGGSGTLTYAWATNGVPISDGGEFSGTTNAALTISPISVADAATYTCTVTGAGGINWTSSGGVLTVNQAVSAPQLVGTAYSATAGLSLGFTNTPGTGPQFTIRVTTNLALAISNWTSLGHPTEITSGNYQFIDATATNKPQQFYSVTSP